jgi:hypothetical protein
VYCNEGREGGKEGRRDGDSWFWRGVMSRRRRAKAYSKREKEGRALEREHTSYGCNSTPKPQPDDDDDDDDVTTAKEGKRKGRKAARRASRLLLLFFLQEE